MATGEYGNNFDWVNYWKNMRLAVPTQTPYGVPAGGTLPLPPSYAPVKRPKVGTAEWADMTYGKYGTAPQEEKQPKKPATTTQATNMPALPMFGAGVPMLPNNPLLAGMYGGAPTNTTPTPPVSGTPTPPPSQKPTAGLNYDKVRPWDIFTGLTGQGTVANGLSGAGGWQSALWGFFGLENIAEAIRRSKIQKALENVDPSVDVRGWNPSVPSSIPSTEPGGLPLIPGSALTPPVTPPAVNQPLLPGGLNPSERTDKTSNIIQDQLDMYNEGMAKLEQVAASFGMTVGDYIAQASAGMNMTPDEFLKQSGLAPQFWPQGQSMYDIVNNMSGMTSDALAGNWVDGTTGVMTYTDANGVKQTYNPTTGEGTPPTVGDTVTITIPNATMDGGSVQGNVTLTREDMQNLFKNSGEYALERYGTGALGLDVGNAGLLGPGLPGPSPEAVTPIPEATPTGGGGGYLPPEEPPEPPGPPKKPKWDETYHVVGAPDWWRGLTIVAGKMTPELEHAMLLNSMIPYMSAEDQRATATQLYIQFPEVFKGYSGKTADFGKGQGETNDSADNRLVNAGGPGIPYLGSEFSDEFRAEFFSKERGKAILDTLALVKSKTKGANKLGPGFRFLQEFGQSIKDFGGESGRMPTRQNISQLMGFLDPLMNSTKSGSLSAYGPLAQNLSRPYFTAGSVLPISKQPDGRYAFGQPNASWM